MDVSEVTNIILNGGLMGTMVAISSLRTTVGKAEAEASKSKTDAETACIDNAESATRIPIENIVKPLKSGFNETKEELSRIRKELVRNMHEMTRFQKAFDGANGYKHRDGCPVLDRLHE